MIKSLKDLLDKFSRFTNSLVYDGGICKRLYNENIKRELYGRYEDDTSALNHEYLDPFNTDFLTIVETISNDINIELSNEYFIKDYLEDIYQVKVQIYGQHEIFDKLEIAVYELKSHLEFFHQKFNDIEEKLNEYYSLSEINKYQFIDESKNFKLLINIFPKEFLNNYDLAKKCIYKMKKTYSSDYEKIQYLLNALQLYTFPLFKENIEDKDESKILLDEYTLLVNNYKEKDAELLKLKIWFYLKSKDFKCALINFNEYFNKYIKMKPKSDESLEILYLGAYAACTVKDKKSLKLFNKYLNKYNLESFENSKSLPYKIYFYQK